MHNGEVVASSWLAGWLSKLSHGLREIGLQNALGFGAKTRAQLTGKLKLKRRVCITFSVNKANF